MRAEAGQIDALTGLRGVAAWWVVLLHFKQFLAPLLPDAVMAVVSQGYLAVDLFFVLSGFVINFSYRGEIRQWDRTVLTFMVRRIARIYPLHLATLGLYLVFAAAILLGSTQKLLTERYSGESLLANLVLLHSWGLFEYLSWNIPSWSISAEFLAYMAFPLFIIATKLATRAVPVLLATAAALLMGIALLFKLAGVSLGERIAELGALRCLFQFALGAVACELYLRAKERGSISPRSAFLAAIGWIGLGSWIGLPNYVVFPLGWAILVYSLAGGGPFSTVLSSRGFVLMGEVSYSTYMIHYFCYDVFKVIGVGYGEVVQTVALVWAIVAIFVASIVLHQYVELPGKRLFNDLGLRALRLAPSPAAAARSPAASARSSGRPTAETRRAGVG